MKKETKRPTNKQVAARKRNWKTRQLKGAIRVLSNILGRDFSYLESEAQYSIDKDWKNALPPWDK